MKLHYTPRLKNVARSLRKAENLSEVLLWKELRAKKLGVPFLRQRPLDNYVVDFFCHQLNLVIEVDGISHDSKAEKDEERQKKLESQGIHFLRFQDKDILYNLDGVLQDIREYINPPSLQTKTPPLGKEE